jgi:hypothetical protein
MFGEVGGIQITFTPPQDEDDHIFNIKQSTLPSRTLVPTIGVFEPDLEDETMSSFNFGRPLPHATHSGDYPRNCVSFKKSGHDATRVAYILTAFTILDTPSHVYQIFLLFPCHVDLNTPTTFCDRRRESSYECIRDPAKQMRRRNAVNDSTAGFIPLTI